MTHRRQTILENVQTLVTGLATTGTNVFRSRLDPSEETDLPCLIVRFQAGQTESVQIATVMAPRHQYRTCSVEVVGYAQDDGDLDATLNQISLEVEQALAMPAASGAWTILTLMSVEIGLTGDGETPLGKVSLMYQAEYQVREDTPDVAA
jgi:hypothetical protein